MEQPDSLDNELRAKLRAAADSELLGAANESQLAALTQALIDESRAARQRKRWLVRSCLAVAAIAAAVLLIVRARPVAPAAEPVAACALPRQVRVESPAGGAPRIELGSFGRLAGSDDAQLSIESAEPCVLRVHLERGELAGDLQNLRPAQLRITTRFGDVVVRGTRFSVAADDGLEVVLLHGKVEVTDERGASTTLAPQQVLRGDQRERRLFAVEKSQSEHIDALLNARPRREAATVEPVVREVSAPDREAVGKSAAALLAKAERERKAGELAAARMLYAEASRFADDDAEVALLRWARFELTDGKAKRASQLLTTHTRRFRRAKLGAEAAWLNIEIMRARGEVERAKRSAHALVEKYPGTPQADAARSFLSMP